MIVTQRFIVLNMPKTGSTFVRLVLARLHHVPMLALTQPSVRRFNNWLNPGFKELHHPNIREHGSTYGLPDQHGTWAQVPERYRSLPVVMVVRNPLDRYASEFYFRWWARHEIVDRAILAKEFTNFPELSFADFLRYKDLEIPVRCGGCEPSAGIGSQTVEFVQMLFKEPQAVLPNLDDQYVHSGLYKHQLPKKLTLLRMENLNTEFYAFLHSMGYPDTSIGHILDEPVIQPKEGTTREAGSGWRTLYSSELLELITRKERLLFQILRDLGISYP